MNRVARLLLVYVLRLFVILLSSFNLAAIRNVCPEMYAITKIADLTKFRQTEWISASWRMLTNCQICQREISLVELTTDLDDFFASHNYLIFQTTGGPCMMINLTTSAIFYTNYIRSETGLWCWRIWRFWRYSPLILSTTLAKSFLSPEFTQGLSMTAAHWYIHPPLKAI